MSRNFADEENGFLLPNGEWCKAKRHINDDGSIGGWVPADMNMPEDVFLDATVIVYPGVEFSPGTKIFGPCQITTKQ